MAKSVIQTSAEQSGSQPRREHRQILRPASWLAAIATLSAVIYVCVAWLSFCFQVDTTKSNIPNVDRPLVAVFVLFVVVFALYVVAVEIVRRSPVRGCLGVIIVGAVVFRVIGWYSNPIQEVDVYRYMWDGVVSNQGISPFRYPPQVVLETFHNQTHHGSDSQLEKLTSVCHNDPAVAEVLARVHFPELPTVYPSISQVVFAVATWATPANVTLRTRLRIMKLVLLLFDLSTLFLVVQLLKTCGMRSELCIAYAWCPLLFKEVANSGHLDSIAVFLSTLAIFLVVRFCFSNGIERAGAKTDLDSVSQLRNRERPFGVSVGTGLAAMVLGLAVAAKLYPIVLIPLFALSVAQRLGWRRVMLPAVIFVATTLLLLWPMMPDPQSTEAGVVDPSAGVQACLRSWEINDFLFMILVENLKPTVNQTPAVWFSVLPDGVRQSLVGFNGVGFVGSEIPGAEHPFFAARIFTSVCFLGIAVWLAVFRSRNIVDETTANRPAAQFCVAAFLTIAWFWLLSPTQNPWYWTWVLPLLPFMRSRAWYAMSGLVLLYYTRFWFEYHRPGMAVFNTRYEGTLFFDFVVTWVEFAPWFVWLAISGMLLRRRSLQKNVQST